MTGAGLRERKKQRTRERIAEVATRLFVERGFEATTIAQVAAEAEVAKMTVTNYFPVKEDLLFDRRPEIVAMLADAVSARGSDGGPLDAVRTAYLEALDARWPALGFIGLEFAELVESSPALRAREREMFVQQEAALAEVLVVGEHDEVAPRVLAAQLAGVVRVLYFEARRRVLAGEPPEHVVAVLEDAARRTFAALEPAA